MSNNRFFSVIVIKADVFESSIIDERHFGNIAEAQSFARSMKNDGYVSVVVEM